MIVSKYHASHNMFAIPLVANARRNHALPLILIHPLETENERRRRSNSEQDFTAVLSTPLAALSGPRRLGVAPDKRRREE